MRVRALAMLSLCSSALLAAGAGTTEEPPASGLLGQVGMVFEQNRGQVDSQARFIARGDGYTLFVTGDGVVMSLSKPDPASVEAEEGLLGRLRPGRPTRYLTTAVRMRLVGSAVKPEVRGEELLPGKASYFIGRDPSRWVTGAPMYVRAVVKDAYPGVDVAYYGAGQHLEYDFVVKPGADPAAIRLAFDGVEKVSLSQEGDLVLKTHLGEIRQMKPTVYQEVGGRRREVGSRWDLGDEGTVRFRVSDYDRSAKLVIDPVTLSWSSFLGGTLADNVNVNGLATDASGYLYVSGYTSSTTFPTQNAYQGTIAGSTDAFVTKLNPHASGAASLLYSTYLGGSSGATRAAGIAVSTGGLAYVTGDTTAGNFPVSLFPAAYQGASAGSNDAFLTVIATTSAGAGSLAYSTYLGGTLGDYGSAVGIDASGNAYVVGQTFSTNFPKTVSAFQSACGGATCNDAFIAKLNVPSSGTGSLLYGSFLGGSTPATNGGTGDNANNVAVDAGGVAYVVGGTFTQNFPTTVSAYQAAADRPQSAFLSKVDTNMSGAGSLVYSTIVNGSLPVDTTHPESVFVGVAREGTGIVYLSGATNDTNFPTLNGYQSAATGASVDAVLVKIDTTVSGSAGLLYSTYFGGAASSTTGVQAIYGVARSSAYPAGLVAAAGLTNSTVFPTVGPYQATNAGGADGFVARFDTTQTGAASLQFSTYLGGGNDDQLVAMTADGTGAIDVAGYTASPDYPTTGSGFQTAYRGNVDGFVSQISATTPVELLLFDAD